MKLLIQQLILIFPFLILTPSLSFSQLIASDPTFPSDEDAVTITFNAALGSGGLAGYTGDVYAHTGVITENSQASGDWKYVQADWGVNIPKCKMTRIGPDLYTLQITPTVRQYYNVPAGEKILQMAFVFRSAQKVGDVWLEGKTEAGGDIFVDLAEEGLQIALLLPEQKGLVNELNDTVPIRAEAQYADSMALYINGDRIKSLAGNLLTDTLVADVYGKYRVKIIAKNDTGSVADSFYYYVRKDPQVLELPQGITEGINVADDNSVILCLYAPYKNYAFVIGDHSNWEVDDESYMNKTPDGKTYWKQLDGLDQDKEYIYQYWVDGEILIGDPYAEKVSDPWNDKYIDSETYPGLIPYPAGKTSGIATVFQTQPDPYTWTETGFTPPAVSDLVVYEVLVRDFVHGHSYQSLIDTLPYFVDPGINAIELMPVNEFEGNISWGYNPSYYFAPDKYYGTKNKLKEFIDECHKNGIAVILDVVFNHSFGQSPMVMLYWDSENGQPAANSPWYNQVPKHDYNVGYDFNHESPDTKRFVDRAVTFWLNEYHVDGFRFDLSKGFTQKNTLGDVNEWGKLDPTRVAILKRIADTIWQTKPGAYVILEHLAENAEEKILAEYGMFLWGNMNYNYCEASMGYTANSNLSWASYKQRGWSKPHAIVYMESHDEERMMYRNLTYGSSSGSYNIKQMPTALERVQLATAFFYTIPGPKMLWQFGEMGYDYSIDYNGRTGPKPIRWDYLEDWRRRYLHDFTKTLIKLKTEQQVFQTTDFALSVAGAMKRVHLNGTPMSVTVLGNFGITAGTIDPNFQHTGTWYEYFTRDSLEVTDVHQMIELLPGEYRLYTDQKLEAPDLSTGFSESYPADSFGLSVFPNPARDRINIAFSLDRPGPVDFGLYSADGVKVWETNNRHFGPGATVFSQERDLLQLNPGIYILEMKAGNASASSKVILY